MTRYALAPALYEMCRAIEIVAPDYRKEIRNVSRFRA